MTRFPEIFAALAAPIPPEFIKTRKHDGIKYITARVVMNAFDTILGPENWVPEYERWSDHAVYCRITITLPDGTKLTKGDVGSDTSMTEKSKGADPGEDEKGGVSDALKRAAVLFGVGRHLYNDGLPTYYPGEVRDESATQTDASGPRQPPSRRREREPPPADPQSRAGWNDFITNTLAAENDAWRNEMALEGVPPEQRHEHNELCNVFQMVNHVCTRLIETSRIEAADINKDGRPNVRDPQKAMRAVVDFYGRFPRAIRKTVHTHLAEIRSKKRATLGMPDLDDDADAEPVGAQSREHGEDG